MRGLLKRLSHPVRSRYWIGQHEEFFAGCAVVSEKIGFVLDWMGSAADQSHQAATALAKKGRQVFGVLGFDIFHAATLGAARPASIRFLCNQSPPQPLFWRGLGPLLCLSPSP